MGKKFENEVQKMSLEALKSMQIELRDKVENGKLSFGKRATNLLKGILIGAGTNLAGGAVILGSMGKEKRDILKRDTREWITENPDVSIFNVNKEFLKSDKEGAKISQDVSKYGTINNIVSLGAIIGSTIALNKSSKRKQEEKLGFVDRELARREAVMQGVTVER